MVYKVRKRNKTNFAEIESRNFLIEHKKKKLKFAEISREGSRQALSVPELTHKKGTAVLYKEKLHIVDKSTKKGVYLQPFSKNKEALENDKIPKKIFIEEKKYEKEVEPVFLPVPIYFSPIILGEKPK